MSWIRWCNADLAPMTMTLGIAAQSRTRKKQKLSASLWLPVWLWVWVIKKGPSGPLTYQYPTRSFEWYQNLGVLKQKCISDPVVLIQLFPRLSAKTTKFANLHARHRPLNQGNTLFQSSLREICKRIISQTVTWFLRSEIRSLAPARGLNHKSLYSRLV